jgi:hypothetical protein
MNKVVLACAAFAVFAFGGLLLVKNNGAKTYYVPPHNSSPLTSPKPIFLEPPTVDQIKSDLSGKTVVVAGKNHQFAGPELNQMNILTSNPTPDGGMSVDVQICADTTIVNRKGVFGMRKTYAHENVCGSLRMYYDKKDGKWAYRMAENIDLQKMIKPNSVAPPSNNKQVFRYPD